MAKLKITKTHSVTSQLVDRYTQPQYINGAYTGGTGGLTNQTGRQINPTVKVGSNSAAAGSILQQKGSHKYQVNDSTDGTGNTGVCTLVNLATPTAANTMSIQVYLANIASVSLASSNVAGGATSATVSWTNGDLTGPVTPRVGDYIMGITGAANVSSTAALVTSVVSATSVTVAATGNVASQTGLTLSDYTYASKINNKFVWDWATTSTPLSTGGTISFYTSGYNPTRLKYHLAAVDNTYVQVNYL